MAKLFNISYDGERKVIRIPSRNGRAISFNELSGAVRKEFVLSFTNSEIRYFGKGEGGNDVIIDTDFDLSASVRVQAEVPEFYVITAPLPVIGESIKNTAGVASDETSR